MPSDARPFGYWPVPLGSEYQQRAAAILKQSRRDIRQIDRVGASLALARVACRREKELRLIHRVQLSAVVVSVADWKEFVALLGALRVWSSVALASCGLIEEPEM